MQPESTESVISRICRALSWADGFALFFVLVNLPTARKALARQVITQFARPVVELTVPQQGFGGTTLDGWLLPQLSGTDETSPVFLHGLDQLLPSGQKQLRHFLQQLNWRRSALAAIKRPLVLWLPRHALDSLAEYAPDFYDWYSNVYEFASPDEEAVQLGNGFRAEFNTEVHPALRQSKAEKEQWLHTLTVLLDEHPERNAYRAKLLYDTGQLHYALGNLDDAFALYKQSLDIYRELGNKQGEGARLNNISQIYHTRGDYETALEYLQQALAIQQEIGDKQGEGESFNNISQIYKARGEYETALNYLEQSLNIRRELGDKQREGVILNNISGIYYALGDDETALNYLKQSLEISKVLGDKQGEGVIFNNISQIYYASGDDETALNYLKQSLEISKLLGDKQGEGVILNNISLIYKAHGDYETALDFLQQSLVIRQETGNKAGLCTTLFNIGHLHRNKGEEEKARQMWVQAYLLAKEIGYADVLHNLEQLAKKLGWEGGLQAWQTLAKKFNLGKTKPD
ncbi:tetratricopeptide repeat protein [Candidatus Electronema sp. PJ]|uniref:tetratricopeptide repeat protein n=1 Tax=Candidatus Electronema sp. PJ TaxID=3401572 RepID=UPI003AA8D3B1